MSDKKVKARPAIVLASQSAARKALLQGAGLTFRTTPAPLDEITLMARLRRQKKSPGTIAAQLARAKALAVSAVCPGALVIGGDQVLECGGQIFSKARTKKDALEKLESLSGRTHRLISAVCVVQDEKILWQFRDKARLKMHDFDEKERRAYIRAAGPALTRAVGGYELESHGAWLFEKVGGDYFTVLGLPLLPLLSYLRKHHGIVP